MNLMNLHAILTVLMGTKYLLVSLGVFKAQATTATEEQPVVFILVKGDVTIDYKWDNITSKTHGDLKSELANHLTNVLKNAYGEQFIKADVSNVRNGSLIFDFRIYFKTNWSSSLDELKAVIKRGEGGVEKFRGRTTRVNITHVFPTECPTEETVDSGLARWLLVLIITGSVIVILLIVVVVLRVQNKGIKDELDARKMHMFSDDEKPFVKTIYIPSVSTLQKLQLCILQETNTPKTALALPHGKEPTTFSPEPESSSGFSNKNYLAIGDEDTETFSPEPESSSGFSNKNYLAIGDEDTEVNEIFNPKPESSSANGDEDSDTEVNETFSPEPGSSSANGNEDTEVNETFSAEPESSSANGDEDTEVNETFSPEPESSSGFSNKNYLASGEEETEVKEM